MKTYSVLFHKLNRLTLWLSGQKDDSSPLPPFAALSFEGSQEIAKNGNLCLPALGNKYILADFQTKKLQLEYTTDTACSLKEEK